MNLRQPTPKKRRGGNWRRAFLSCLAETGSPSRSASAAGIHRDTAYGAREKDAKFAEAWASAVDDAVESLELEARRRAFEGLIRKKFDKGRPVIDTETQQQYFEREYSDTLLIFLLKAHRPEMYRDRYDFRHSGQVDSVVSITSIQAVAPVMQNGELNGSHR